MFTVNSLREEKMDFVVLQNSEKTTKAKISLNEGGSLQELKLNNKLLIKKQPNFNYKISYASSVLFPFPSRIENGEYSFQEKEYQLNCNEGKNALHGLIYNKKFSEKKKSESLNHVSITIEYEETKETKGFPFTYKVQLTYKLYKEEINLSIKIENTDSKPFPFTLGWHPYFLCNDFKNSYLKFKSDKRIEFNQNLITKRVIDHKTNENFKIEDKQLDDCFILNSEAVEFYTPNYQIEILSSQLENYLQLYTPKDLPIIAIEPMTGISNSFNNKIGLQVLEPKKEHSITWIVNTINN